jgi:hypothetical protein
VKKNLVTPSSDCSKVFFHDHYYKRNLFKSFQVFVNGVVPFPEARFCNGVVPFPEARFCICCPVIFCGLLF